MRVVQRQIGFNRAGERRTFNRSRQRHVARDDFAREIRGAAVDEQPFGRRQARGAGEIEAAVDFKLAFHGDHAENTHVTGQIETAEAVLAVEVDFSRFRRQGAFDGGICHVKRVVLAAERDVPVDGRFGEAQFGVRVVGERDVAVDGRAAQRNVRSAVEHDVAVEFRIRQRNVRAICNRQRSRRQAAADDVPCAGSAERGVDRERLVGAHIKIADRQAFAAGN